MTKSELRRIAEGRVQGTYRVEVEVNSVGSKFVRVFGIQVEPLLSCTLLQWRLMGDVVEAAAESLEEKP